MKFLLWLAIVAAVVMWFLRAKKTEPESGAARRQPDQGKAAGRATEAMLQCAQCGVHFPASEAVANSAGLVFCSEEHRLQHADR